MGIAPALLESWKLTNRNHHVGGPVPFWVVLMKSLWILSLKTTNLISFSNESWNCAYYTTYVFQAKRKGKWDLLLCFMSNKSELVLTNYKSELATNSEQGEQYNVYIREKKSYWIHNKHNDTNKIRITLELPSFSRNTCLVVEICRIFTFLFNISISRYFSNLMNNYLSWIGKPHSWSCNI